MERGSSSNFLEGGWRWIEFNQIRCDTLTLFTLRSGRNNVAAVMNQLGFVQNFREKASNYSIFMKV